MVDKKKFNIPKRRARPAPSPEWLEKTGQRLQLTPTAGESAEEYLIRLSQISSNKISTKLPIICAEILGELWKAAIIPAPYGDERTDAKATQQYAKLRQVIVSLKQVIDTYNYNSDEGIDAIIESTGVKLNRQQKALVRSTVTDLGITDKMEIKIQGAEAALVKYLTDSSESDSMDNSLIDILDAKLSEFKSISKPVPRR